MLLCRSYCISTDSTFLEHGPKLLCTLILSWLNSPFVCPCVLYLRSIVQYFLWHSTQPIPKTEDVKLFKPGTELTCMPIMAYIKNSIAISKQTYGSALNDCTKVQRRMRIVYPWRSNFIRRAARNKRRKPTLIEFDCKILLVKGRKREKQKIWRVVLEWLCPGNFSSTRSSVRIWF